MAEKGLRNNSLWAVQFSITKFFRGHGFNILIQKYLFKSLSKTSYLYFPNNLKDNI